MKEDSKVKLLESEIKTLKKNLKEAEIKLEETLYQSFYESQNLFLIILAIQII